ncbi:hypothetical protein F4802DRAFT_560765 [Xylaria palmicola]|nr:hypothetical protein F4802DRAFT_560765 [Xylaria palmicola]
MCTAVGPPFHSTALRLVTSLWLLLNHHFEDIVSSKMGLGSANSAKDTLPYLPIGESARHEQRKCIAYAGSGS